MTFGDDTLGVRVPANRVQQRMFQYSRCTHHLGCHVAEVRDRERRNNHRAVNVGDQSVQPIEGAVRSERTVVVGQGDKRPFIERDPELISQFS